MGLNILARSKWTWCLLYEVPPPSWPPPGPRRPELLSSEPGPKPERSRANLCSSALIWSSPGQDWTALQTNLGWVWSESGVTFWAGMKRRQDKFQMNWFLSIMGVFFLSSFSFFFFSALLILLLFWILILRATPCLPIAMRVGALSPLLPHRWRK